MFIVTIIQRSNTMKDFAKVGSTQMALLVAGAIIGLIVPVIIAIVWTVKKKEKFTTVLIGAATFLLFALILEKPIQNVLVFPTQMGLPEHAISRFLSAKPFLFALVLALFPGVFEETGRFVAFKTVLKNRKNRETSISHGIGHGGVEVMFLFGLTFITNISYAIMINTGTFSVVVDQVMTQAPDQIDQLYLVADQLANFPVSGLLLAIMERIFAVLFHTGASILVFYACKDKKKFWLYPLAIILHTAMDGVAALNMAGVITLSTAALEIFAAVFGLGIFFGAYLGLYRKDA